MKYLYLDHNVYIKASKNELLYNSLIELKQYGIQCVYSPAHLEEIFKVEYSNSSFSQNAKNLKDVIADITCGTVLLPSMGEIIIKQEDLKKRFDVVKKIDTREFMDNFATSCLDKMDNSNTTATNLQHISYREIWDQEDVAKELKNLQLNWEVELIKHKVQCLLCRIPNNLPYNTALKKDCYEVIKHSHSQLEFIISLLTDILDKCKYYPNKNLHTISSGIHDLTHTIYATKADYFITMDKNLFKRCQAIYYYIGIDAKKVKYRKTDEELIEVIGSIKKECYLEE